MDYVEKHPTRIW